MLARCRDRLSYANVVATLALFVALGGTGYAASQITSNDVKNRSLKGGDLKKDTITGTEIRESKLKRVPSAQNAATADVSKSAGTATTAGSATTAALADTAKDAQSLAGQGVGAFERSNRTQFGRTASFAPADEAGEGIALNVQDMGVAVTSATNQGACGAGAIRVAVRNTKATGPTASVFGSTGPASVVPGGKQYYCSNAGNGAGLVISDSTGRSIFIQCAPDAPSGGLVCLGTRSAP